MKLIAAAAIAMAIAAPAQADISKLCTSLGQIAYQGAVDGLNSAPIMENLGAHLYQTGAPLFGLERLVTASYLIGYAAGQLDGDPAEAAAEVFNGCMSEPV